MTQQTLEYSNMTIWRNGFEEEVEIEGYVDYYIDRDFGADADGNRGVARMFVEEVRDITAYNLDGDEIELTESEKERAGEILGDKAYGM